MGGAIHHLLFQPPPKPRKYPHEESYCTYQTIRNSLGNRISTCFINYQYDVTIIYSHGNAEDLSSTVPFLLDEICPRFQANVLCYDYSGYGLSDGSPSEEAFYSDIRAVYRYARRRLRLEPETIILMGVSIGSAPSIELARLLSTGGLDSRLPAVAALHPDAASLPPALLHNRGLLPRAPLRARAKSVSAASWSSLPANVAASASSFSSSSPLGRTDLSSPSTVALPSSSVTTRPTMPRVNSAQNLVAQNPVPLKHASLLKLQSQDHQRTAQTSTLTTTSASASPSATYSYAVFASLLNRTSAGSPSVSISSVASAEAVFLRHYVPEAATATAELIFLNNPTPTSNTLTPTSNVPLLSNVSLSPPAQNTATLPFSSSSLFFDPASSIDSSFAAVYQSFSHPTLTTTSLPSTADADAVARALARLRTRRAAASLSSSQGSTHHWHQTVGDHSVLNAVGDAGAGAVGAAYGPALDPLILDMAGADDLAVAFADDGDRLRGLILQSPLCSIARIALRFSIPGDMFCNVDRIGAVRTPTLVIHGERDDVVPCWHGKELHRRCMNAVQPLWLPLAGHNDVEAVGDQDFYGCCYTFIHDTTAVRLPAGTRLTPHVRSSSTGIFLLGNPLSRASSNSSEDD